MSDEYRLVVDAGGERLDKFVAIKLPQFSRALVQRWIEEARIKVNGRGAAPSFRLQPGDQVEVRVPAVEPATLEPQPIPLEILYEDADLIVVNKPAGLVVHPAAGHARGTLVNALLHHASDLVIHQSERPGIVHRLDRDTSGVMVVAKNDATLTKLQEQFKTREVVKTYLALALGHIATPRGRIEAPIGRDPGDRKKMAARAGERSREAETEFVVRAQSPSYTLVELHPRTGRTHQIRVHLAFIGHPVVGDNVYGTQRAPAVVRRQLLHAWTLAFRHPQTGAALAFTAPIPADMAEALQACGFDLPELPTQAALFQSETGRKPHGKNPAR